MSEQGPAAVATASQDGDRDPGPPPGARGPGRPWWRAAFFVLAAAALVAGAAWALLGSSFLVVRSVRVTGTGPVVSRAQVLAAARIPLGRPLIRIDDTAVARRVGTLTWVRSAQVSTDWPDTIVIAIRLRVPVFAVATGTATRPHAGYEVIDRSGVGLRVTATPPAGLPLLVAGAPGEQPATLRGSPAVLAAATVLGELPHRVALRVRTVMAPSAEDVSVRLAGGTVVVWGDTGQAALKSRVLTVLMRTTHARVYDVSAPGNVMTAPSLP